MDQYPKFALVRFDFNNSECCKLVSEICEKTKQGLTDFTPEHKDDFNQNKWYFSKRNTENDKDNNGKPRWSKISILRLGDTEKEIFSNTSRIRHGNTKFFPSESSFEDNINNTVLKNQNAKEIKSQKTAVLKERATSLAKKLKSSSNLPQFVDKEANDAESNASKVNDASHIAPISSVRTAGSKSSESSDEDMNKQPTPWEQLQLLRQKQKKNSDSDSLDDTQECSGDSSLDKSLSFKKNTKLLKQKRKNSTVIESSGSDGSDDEEQKDSDDSLSDNSQGKTMNSSHQQKTFVNEETRKTPADSPDSQLQHEEVEADGGVQNDQPSKKTTEKKTAYGRNVPKFINDCINYYGKTGPGYEDRKQRRYRIINDKIYLGEDIAVDFIQWRLITAPNPLKRDNGCGLFLRNLIDMLWDEKDLCNRALDVTHSMESIPNRSPVKLIQPNLFRLYISLFNDYLNSLNISDNDRAMELLNAKNALRYKIRDLRGLAKGKSNTARNKASRRANKRLRYTDN